MLLEINDLHKSYGDREILKGVSIAVEEGQVLGIIGPSGSGKSTLLRCIDYLERAESGTITLDGRTVLCEKPTKKDIAYLRQHTTMVFQQFNLFKYKTALENVTEGPLIVQRRDKAEVEKQARELLEVVGLKGFEDRYPVQLSGGQQQRVAIARALALQPKVMLLDEPTSALDPEMVGEVLPVIRKLANQGRTMIIVSHEMEFIRGIADQVVFMDAGSIVEAGTVREIFNFPKTERLCSFLRKVGQIEDYVI